MMTHIDHVHNIYCIGRNYRKHAQELGNSIPKEPIVFLKNSASLRTCAQSQVAFAEETFHFEAEIVIRINNFIQMKSKASLSDINGIALGIDLTRRGVQGKLKSEGKPWTLAKNFKGSSILTPFCTHLNQVNLHNIAFEFYLNQTLRQKGHSRNMMFDFVEIMNFLLIHHDLEANDIIFTGTPEGVGEMNVGDKFSLQSQCLNLHVDGVL